MKPKKKKKKKDNNTDLRWFELEVAQKNGQQWSGGGHNKTNKNEKKIYKQVLTLKK